MNNSNHPSDGMGWIPVVVGFFLGIGLGTVVWLASAVAGYFLGS